MVAGELETAWEAGGLSGWRPGWLEACVALVAGGLWEGCGCCRGGAWLEGLGGGWVVAKRRDPERYSMNGSVRFPVHVVRYPAVSVTILSNNR